MSGFGLTAEATEQQHAEIEALRARLNSAYGTDNAHWVAAAELVMSGILDKVRQEAREATLAPLQDLSDIETLMITDVLAADVWDSREGRTCDYVDLSALSQRVQRETARRHLDALRRFLSR